jgi:hypothetical protein
MTASRFIPHAVRHAFSLALALALAATLLTALAPLSSRAASTPPEESLSHDGLQKTRIKGLDLAYMRPGAPLAGYKRIQLDPVEVSFDPTWNPTRTGSQFKLSAEEREHIRAGVARIVQDEFARELQAGSGYPLVTDAAQANAPDVLRVKVGVINLYVNAPDTMSAGRTRTYTLSAGEMTLVAELFDAESGAVLARLVDRREARNTGQLTLSNSVMNAAQAEQIAARWARILRKNLEQAQQSAKR